MRVEIAVCLNNSVLIFSYHKFKYVQNSAHINTEIYNAYAVYTSVQHYIPIRNMDD